MKIKLCTLEWGVFRTNKIVRWIYWSVLFGSQSTHSHMCLEADHIVCHEASANDEPTPFRCLFSSFWVSLGKFPTNVFIIFDCGMLRACHGICMCRREGKSRPSACIGWLSVSRGFVAHRHTGSSHSSTPNPYVLELFSRVHYGAPC